jgi:hypothetical protein
MQSWGPLIAGHAHPDVVAAVSQAAERGTSFGAPTEAEVELAGEVVEREPQRAHGCLGPGGGHPHHLGGRHAFDHFTRELDLGLRGGPEARATLGCLAHRRHHVGVRMTGDQRAPGLHPIDVAVAVDVDQVGALPRGDEDRIAPDRVHRPHRRVDPARQQPLRLGEK